MQTETMTVHEALCERKTLEKRIEKVINEFNPLACKEQAAKNVTSGVSVETFTENAKKDEEKANSLINRLNALVAAINQYNASEQITVGTKTYTIAEAIWMMQHGMDNKKKLLRKYEGMLSNVTREITLKNGAELNKAAERAADVALGGKDKTDGKEYLDMVENYKERHQLVFVDPLDIRKRILELEEEISTFETHVDAKIQSANARTEITIEY